MAQQVTADKPLAGVRIIELSTMVTASLSSMMLAAQGADVIKVEPARNYRDGVMRRLNLGSGHLREAGLGEDEIKAMREVGTLTGG